MKFLGPDRAIEAEFGCVKFSDYGFVEEFVDGK